MGYAAGQWLDDLEWSNQSLDLNMIEIIWHDLKKAIRAQTLQLCSIFLKKEKKKKWKEDWDKILYIHSNMKDSSPVIANAWLL